MDEKVVPYVCYTLKLERPDGHEEDERMCFDLLVSGDMEYVSRDLKESARRLIYRVTRHDVG